MKSKGDHQLCQVEPTVHELEEGAESPWLLPDYLESTVDAELL